MIKHVKACPYILVYQNIHIGEYIILHLINVDIYIYKAGLTFSELKLLKYGIFLILWTKFMENCEALK